MRGLDAGMAAAIFRLSRRSVFIQTLPSKEQDRGIGCLLPKIGDEGSRQPASHSLVVVKLDVTVDPYWLCGADYASVKA
jgi:hypothetical protein